MYADSKNVLTGVIDSKVGHYLFNLCLNINGLMMEKSWKDKFRKIIQCEILKNSMCTFLNALIIL